MEEEKAKSAGPGTAVRDKQTAVEKLAGELGFPADLTAGIMAFKRWRRGKIVSSEELKKAKKAFLRSPADQKGGQKNGTA